MTARYDEVEVGDVLPERTVVVTRRTLVMYAGAGGDFNPIHWNERIAKSAGLPDVIAHGMYTMAQVGRLVTDWAGDPGAVTDFRVRFSAPVVVPDDDDGAAILIGARVVEVLPDHHVRVEIQASSAGAAVVTAAEATVRLP